MISWNIIIQHAVPFVDVPSKLAGICALKIILAFFLRFAFMMIVFSVTDILLGVSLNSKK